jgi:hypothetical protein
LEGNREGWDFNLFTKRERGRKGKSKREVGRDKYEWKEERKDRRNIDFTG